MDAKRNMGLSGSLSGTRAVVVGASGGLGRAISIALAARGARVGLVGRDVEKLEATRTAMGAGGEDAPVFTCDLTKRDEVAALATKAGEALGQVDILVNAAGQNVKNRSLRSLDPDD